MLAVSVMSSLKMHFNKSCKQFLACTCNVGRVITEAGLASLMGQAWPLALTPNNLTSGFCKTGIYPLHPGRITDVRKAPSLIYNREASEPPSDLSDTSGQSQQSPLSVQSLSVHSSASKSSRSIDEILVLPKSKVTSKKTRAGLTTVTQCTTESPFLDRLRERKAMREERLKKTKKPKPRSKHKIRAPKKTYQKKTASARLRTQIQQAKQKEQESDANISAEEDEMCGVCGVLYGTDNKLWIECGECTTWFHTSCVDVDDKSIPDVFLCPDCDS